MHKPTIRVMNNHNHAFGAVVTDSCKNEKTVHRGMDSAACYTDDCRLYLLAASVMATDKHTAPEEAQYGGECDNQIMDTMEGSKRVWKTYWYPHPCPDIPLALRGDLYMPLWKNILISS